jgi:diadenylate cyclase
MYLLSSSLTEYFKQMSLWSVVDLVMFLIIAVLLFMFFKRHQAIKMAVFLSIYMLLYIAIYVLSIIVGGDVLRITLKLLEFTTIFLIVLVVIVYQSDFKVLFAKIVRNSDKAYDGDTSEEALLNASHEIVTACQNMSKNKVGALIIILRTTVPDRILDTGTQLNALVSAGLLESIFSTKGPMHDGAVVIRGNKILSAGCFLPLSKEVDIAKELGTRHRAAIGITEESDVFAIVASEETGIISVVENGKIRRWQTPDKLLGEIKGAYNISAAPKQEKKKVDKKKFI